MKKIIFILFLSACNQNSTYESSIYKDEVNKLSNNSETLQRRVESLENQLSTLSSSFIQYKFDNNFSMVTIDPADGKKFKIIDTSLGRLFISLISASTNADGVVAHLNIGNPYVADISGITLEMEYGKRFIQDKNHTALSFDDIKNYDNWSKNLSKKTESIDTNLRAGRWTKVDIFLPNQSLENFGYLSIKMKTSEIQLLINQ